MGITLTPLQTRVISGAVFGAVVLAAVFMGGAAFVLLMAVMASASAYEWGRMVLTGQEAPKLLFPIVALLSALCALATAVAGNPAMTLWILFAFCFLVYAFNASRGGPPVWLLCFGMVYTGFSIGVMLWLRNVTDDGLYNVLTLLLIVWASDVSAYFSGRAVGGPKLAPTISPNKTWAGFFGSSLGAAFVCFILALPPVVEKFSATPIGHMSPWGYAAMGFFLAMFGQAGDLFISLFKRRYGLKDTGALIPGHGGILDRIDALLLVAVIFGALAVVLR